jgi:ArsR family transcriptional regulator, arsenate/arsenite/antimonite-responsive transcriptional repressor
MNMDSYNCCSPNKKEGKDVSDLSSLLKLVAEESRLKLLCVLRQGKHCVCELIDHSDMSQSLISHHLKDLKEAGLVSDEKQGQWVYYSLTDTGRKTTDLLFQIKK